MKMHERADGTMPADAEQAFRARAGLTPVFAYARVSTAGQAHDDDLEGQLTRLRAYARLHRLRIEKIFKEVRHCALSSSEDRPKLHRCVAEARAKGYQILTTSPSRLSRDGTAAWHLHDNYPGGFIFAEPLPDFAGQPWPVEVIERHEKFYILTSTGTSIAMDRLKAEGRKLGAGDGGVAGRQKGLPAIKAAREARREKMAQVLRTHPSWPNTTRRDAVQWLNDHGQMAAHGGKWTMDAVTRPLRDAKKAVSTVRSATPVSTGSSSVADALGSATVVAGQHKDLAQIAAAERIGSSESGLAATNQDLQEVAVLSQHEAILHNIMTFTRVPESADTPKKRAEVPTMNHPLWGRF